MGNTVRKFFKYLLRTVVIVIVFLLILPFSIYLPVVQKYAKNKAVAYIGKQTGIKAEIGNFSLKFPFRVQLENLWAKNNNSDTLFCVGHLSLDIGLSGILKKELAVKDLSIHSVCVDYSDSLTGVHLGGRLETLKLVAPLIKWGEKRITVTDFTLKSGDIRWAGGGNTTEKDTTVAETGDWLLELQKLRLDSIRYTMKTPSLPFLSVQLAEGSLVNGILDLGVQRIKADSVEIRNGACRITTLSGNGNPEAEPADVKNESGDSATLWSIEAGSVALADYAFSMNAEREKGFELNLSRIGIRLDSVYNRGTTVKAALKHLQVVRREGGEITDMKADVNLNNWESALTGAYIQTPNSLLNLEAIAGGSVNEIAGQVPLYLKLDAAVGMKDIALLGLEIPETLGKEKINLHTVLNYRPDLLRIDRLSLTMPGNFRIEGQGTATSLRNWRALSGKIAIQGEIENSQTINLWLKDKISLPSPLRLTLQAEAEKGIIKPDFRLCQKKGCVRLSGVYNLPEEKYLLHFNADTFSLAAFLPSASLGNLTATAEIEGQGIKWPRANARLTLDIRALDYKRHVYTGVGLTALLEKTRLDAALKSADPALLLDFGIQADSIDNQYLLQVTGKVEKADLKALHWVSQEWKIATEVEINALATPLQNYLLNADLNRVTVDNGGGDRNLGNATILLNSSLRDTRLNITSGDFRLHFRGDTLVTELSSMFAQAAAELQQQITVRHLDMDRLQAILPHFKLDVQGHADNVIGKYLKAQKIGFQNLTLHAGALPERGVYFLTEVTRPLIGNIDLDSLILHIRQEEQGIAYKAKAISGNGAMKDLYHIALSGTVGKNELSLLLHQQDREGKVGVNIGGAVTLGDSSATLHLFPASPVLGTASWTLNEGNRIELYRNHRLDADLQLGDGKKMLKLRSYMGEDRKEQLQVEIKGINLASVSRFIPFIPDLGGSLNTDLLLSPEKTNLGAEGKITIDSFSFQKRKIGNIELDLKYDIGQQPARHAVDFVLHLNGVKRILAKGAFSTSPADRTVNLNLEIPSLPLELASLFLPENFMNLYGDLHGRIDLGGTFDTPLLDGHLAFRDAGTEIVMLGTRFDIDSSVIPIKQGKIELNGFGITAPNKKRLGINGEIALLPWEAMACKLLLGAENFQIVNVKKNETSLVYGKAYVDLNIALNGPFNALNLTGNINLLNNTVLDYVLRNSSPELKDHTRDLVRFVSFGDSTLTEKDELTNRFNTGSFTMKLLVEIGEAVNMNINLSEDGNNRVAIQGGGNLIYSMSPASGNSLVGKYILGGGMVRYGIPVVGEKNFTIQSGSYIEWTGNLLEPILHITAATAVRVSVTEDNQSSRIVNFEVLIRIEDDLRLPRITFDLTAPNDQAIQTQLAAFSADERTKQAMNLLIYGTYTGPGTVNTGTNANNTLNNFVEKELNQWTRKYLKNTNLTFGIDTYNQIGADGQEVKRTDYSYQFSKQLFNDKINVKVGGRISSDNDPGTSMEDNLIDDIAIEYMFTKKRNLLMKVFRHTNYESVLEGEVTQTGIGIVWRKSFRKLKEIFKGKKQKNGREN